MSQCSKLYLFLSQIYFNQTRFICVIDYQKVFDNVQHNKLIEILKEIGLGEKDLKIISNSYWYQYTLKEMSRKIF